MKYYKVIFYPEYYNKYGIPAQNQFKIKALNTEQAEARAMKIAKRKEWFKKCKYTYCKTFNHNGNLDYKELI